MFSTQIARGSLVHKVLSIISVFTLVLGTSPALTSAATIFNDGFESGNFSNWSSADNDWSVTSGSGHSGNRKAEVSDQGQNDDSLQKDVSTAGYNNIVLSYYYKTGHALESNDHVRVEWWNGSSWNQVADHFSINNGGWTLASFNLGAGANNLSTFKIRFRATGLEGTTGNGDKDEFQLDDVTVAGSALPADTDGDTIPDTSDNCPTTANTNQTDSDNDGLGDECDSTPNGNDVCPNVTGDQAFGPCADTECPAESTWSIDLQECVENPPTDEEICLENGDQWIEGECYTDAEACELQEGMSWNGDECVTDEVPPTDEEVCLEGGGNWVNDECLTDEELCVAQDGMAWVDGECLSHDIICDTFEMLNIPQPDYCDNDTEENEPVDTDNDGIVDEEDNCPTVANADQADANENSIGDACEDTNNDSEETNEQETPSGGGSSGGGRIEKACDNNVDDDGDGLYDMNDPGCTSTTDNSEENPGEVLGASTANTCSALLTTYMRINRENDVEEVKKLQTFLNDELGLTLEVNGIFDQATHDAVNSFQLKYESEVLTPWGPFGLPAGTPTGYVYKTTQRWINMKHCASLNLPMPELK